MLHTAATIAKLGIDGVKLHLLYVVKETPLETLYRQGEFHFSQKYAVLRNSNRRKNDVI